MQHHQTQKVCRHCGVALNPEQAVCVNCQSKIDTENLAAALMAGVNHIILSNVASSIPKKFKQLPKQKIIVQELR